MVHGSWFTVMETHTERLELIVLKELLVLGSWFTALETHTENGPDFVQRVAASWTMVLGSWFTALET